MSRRSSFDGGSERGSDSDSVDDSSQVLRLLEEKDPKWLEYLSDEDEIDLKPKLSIEDRIRLEDEREKEMIRKAQERGMAKIPDDYVPPVEVDPEEKMRAKIERYNAWCEKIKRIEREKAELVETSKKLERAEYEKYAKLQKEYRTRDYYWKPDPLYSLHMKELGYSKIAIDKALFYTDNRSVARAVEYLKKNPNPTELTKEEVMAAGEEVLKRIRPVKPRACDQIEEATLKEGEMEVEEASQALYEDDCSTGITTSDDSPNEEMKEHKVVPKDHQFLIPKDYGMAKGRIRRGTKRSYSGEEVKSGPTTSTNLRLPPIKEKNSEYKMIFMINSSLLMDAITLSLEVGKVVANLANKIRVSGDEHEKMFDDWIKEGSKMSTYKGNDTKHLDAMFQWTSESGVLSYLGQCSHYRDVKTPSSTVLGVFGEAEKLERFQDHLEML